MLQVFKEKLDTIKNEIIFIGDKVVKANELALSGLVEDKAELFNDAKSELNNIENLSNKIDNLIVTTLALHAPEAKDLRSLVSYLKITNEVVRASSNTKSFIKAFSKAMNHDVDVEKVKEYAIPLHKSTILSLKTALVMINLADDNDTEDYFHKVIVEESKTDDLYSMIEKNLLKLITKNRDLSKDYFDLLGSFRRLEKVADRAASIANLLLFAHIGGEILQA
ncbi:phosphate signaling complex PhoU family protein [Candidatus Marinarcus aquaticus]|uniref:PhoU family transcriptional regulator n=1 Tax=Candidatus Marinarcus aquaticus TaxID=2044504 RepID=A0A4Q0XT09_9BACT|nr:PhoU domain-containing protein [Candidatus Marinarcus aquaticus]RXJ57906.1 PhoU family transcriptional regulator [Candidatus Marinarcus aquaticus]